MPAVSTNRHVLAAELDELVDRVAGGARDRVDHRALLAGELVQQAGLADVRAADQRHPARPGLFLPLRRRLGQRLEHQVEQVAAAPAVHGADHDGLAKAQGPQRHGVGLALGIVHLVRREHDRLARPAEHVRHRLVRVGGADPRVDHEQHGVREADGDLRLLGDLGGQALRASASQPPVSTTVNVRPRQIASYATRSLVTPGTSSTTASRLPRMRLTSVDLPTLGRPDDRQHRLTGLWLVRLRLARLQLAGARLAGLGWFHVVRSLRG